jgi:hypothetical protein
MRMTISRSSTLAVVLVGALSAPTVAQVKDTAVTARTHTVHRGETLWQLAREYLNNPFQWQEIFRLNTQLIANPHWIYPGQMLRIPGSGLALTTPDRPFVEAMPADTTAAVAAPTQSIFRRAEPPVARAETRTSSVAPAAAPSVRVGEYLSAPFVERAGGPVGAGRIVGSGEVPGIPLTEERRLLQIRERIFVVPPAGSSASPGDRYVAFARSRAIPDVGQVLVPTGVVVIDRAEPGQAAEGRIIANYGEMFIAQQLVPLEVNVPDSLAQLRAVENGAESRVVWISGGDPALPTIQNYVVIDAGLTRGLREGDQVSFIRPKRTTDDGVVLPESEIGIARVVRVSPTAATAIILRQTYPAIALGTLARVTAKLP